MKKVLALVLAGVLALGTYTVAFAAPPTEAPSEMSVEQDGNFHSVYVFGTALALVNEDGSITIYSMGPVGRVDVMMDGVVIKNVSSVTIPAGQRTKMALDENSIIVENVTAESAEAIKKQVDDAYAAGAESIDLGIFAEDVVAYKVNADGVVEDADGVAVPVSTVDMSVNSISTTAETFEEVVQELMEEERAASQPAPISSSSSSSSSSSGSSSSATSAPATSTAPSTPAPATPAPATPAPATPEPAGE